MLNYKSVIRSQISYCSLVWMLCSRHTNNMITYIQKPYICPRVGYERHFKPFQVNVPILYPQKTTESQRVFRGYKMRILDRNRLIVYNSTEAAVGRCL